MAKKQKKEREEQARKQVHAIPTPYVRDPSRELLYSRAEYAPGHCAHASRHARVYACRL